MNLGRLRQRIYSPPPLTTRALPREPWNSSPIPGRFQPRRRPSNRQVGVAGRPIDERRDASWVARWDEGLEEKQAGVVKG